MTSPPASLPPVTLGPAPGHTPAARGPLAGEGRAALITADRVHHPVLLARTEVCVIFDTDPAQAVRTRQALPAEAPGTGALLLGPHFAPPTGGCVRRDGDGRLPAPCRHRSGSRGAEHFPANP